MNDVILHDEPMVLVVFGNDFPIADYRGTTSPPFPLAEILRDGDSALTVSDQVVKERVANYFDFGQVATQHLIDHYVVRRPQTGNITVEYKAVFG